MNQKVKKMKIKTLYEPIEPITIESYLTKCGVIDVEEYLVPKGKYIQSPYDYENLDMGVNLFNTHYLNKSKTYILCDSGDCDGICSTTIIFKYMKLLNPNWDIVILIHKGKERGLQDDILYEKIKLEKPNLVIIPDSGTNDGTRVKELLEIGIDSLIIDHHDFELEKIVENTKNSVLINCQLGNVDKKSSAGVVVQRFLKALDIKYNVNYSNKFLDLASLSVISDSMDVTSMQNRAYLHYGIMNRRINNPFLKVLLNTFIGDKEFTQRDISFKIVPKINSVCRSENMSLKREVISAFLGNTTFQTYEEIAELCKGQHEFQTKTCSDIVEKFTPKLKENAKLNFLYDDCIPRAYSGLIAGKFMSVPTIVGKLINGTLVGSMRSPIPIREIINNSGYFEFASGHSNSFGVGIKEENIKPFLDWVNSDAFNLDYTPHISVLQSYPIKSFPTRLFGLFEPYNQLWGYGLPQPTFYIQKFRIKNTDIQIMGANQRTIKWKKGAIEFIKFQCTRQDKIDLKLGTYENEKFIPNNKEETIEVEVVGIPQVNRWEWSGKEYSSNQILIEKMEVMEHKDELEF